MQKIISLIMLTASLLFIPLLSSAYCVRNNTDTGLEVRDTASFWTGMKRHVPAHESACCDPNSSGCSGNIKIAAGVNLCSKVGCYFVTYCRGNEVNFQNRGNYVDINQVRSGKPGRGWCEVINHKASL